MGELIASIAAAIAMIATFPSAIAGASGLLSSRGAASWQQAQADHARQVEKWKRAARQDLPEQWRL